MRIGVDARLAARPESGHVGGIPQYTREIISGLLRRAPEEIVLFGNDTTSSVWDTVPLFGNHFAFPQTVRRAGVQLFFSPSGLAPLGLSVPFVPFIHDLLILKHPEWFPDSSLQRLFTLKGVLPRTIHRARHLFVPSQQVRRDLVTAFPGAAKKTTVVWEGVTPRNKQDYPLTDTLRTRFGIAHRYIITVATLEPRKDFLSAIKGFEALLLSRPELAREFQYVIAGKCGWGSAAVLAEVRAVNARWQHRSPEVIRYVGSVQEKEKWALYANAEACLWTSLAEGFGLPPLEAMAMQTPVVSTPVGVLPEIAIGAAHFLRSVDPEEVRDALFLLMESPAKALALAKKGKEVADMLTWDRAAEQTLDLLHQAVR